VLPYDYHQKRASEPIIPYRQLIDSLGPGHVRPDLSTANSEFVADGTQLALASRRSNTIAGADPLGLTLVYTLPNPLFDLIFVHGLGGSSKRTWSWERDIQNFWPSWLAQDNDLSGARIFTFGYNSGFTGQYTNLNMLDFAKDLLLRMKTFSTDDYLNMNNSPAIGDVGSQSLHFRCKDDADLLASYYLHRPFDGRTSC
jgi:hypothetical protein